MNSILRHSLLSQWLYTGNKRQPIVWISGLIVGGEVSVTRERGHIPVEPEGGTVTHHRGVLLCEDLREVVSLEVGVVGVQTHCHLAVREIGQQSVIVQIAHHCQRRVHKQVCWGVLWDQVGERIYHGHVREVNTHILCYLREVEVI
jgi:hypothetical protein